MRTLKREICKNGAMNRDRKGYMWDISLQRERFLQLLTLVERQQATRGDVLHISEEKLQQWLDNNFIQQSRKVCNRSCHWCMDGQRNPDSTPTWCCKSESVTREANNIIFFVTDRSLGGEWYIHYPNKLQLLGREYRKFGRIMHQPNHFVGECYESRNSVIDFDSILDVENVVRASTEDDNPLQRESLTGRQELEIYFNVCLFG